MKITNNIITKIKNQLAFLPLGGTGEIGNNLNLYQYKGKWLIVDVGLGFKNSKIPGVDVTIPNIKILQEISQNIVGIIITHGHEDHIGGLPYIWPEIKCPIYTTKLTSYLIKQKFQDHKLKISPQINDIKINQITKIGNFTVQIIPITHSIPETHAIFISTQYGNIFHTGDWRFEKTPIIGRETSTRLLKQIGQKKILAMIGDSTNVFIEKKSRTELELYKNLHKIIKKHDTGLIIITTFASNISRLHSLFTIAENVNRNIILIGRSLYKMYKAGTLMGYLKKVTIFQEKDFDKLKRSKTIIICTGCQGEKKAALYKIVNNINIKISIKENDTVIFSSKIIPGNEEKMHHMYNILSKQKVQVYNEYNAFVHTSGHPSREEIIEMYNYIKPKIAIPVHGESFHITEHCKIAKKCGIKSVMQIENGQIVILNKKSPYIVDKIQCEKYAVDGNIIINSTHDIFNERTIMKENGVIIMQIILTQKNITKIIFNKIGLIVNKNIVSMIKDQVNQLTNKIVTININSIKNQATEIIKTTLKKCANKTPIIQVSIHEEKSRRGELNS